MLTGQQKPENTGNTIDKTWDKEKLEENSTKVQRQTSRKTYGEEQTNQDELQAASSVTPQSLTCWQVGTLLKALLDKKPSLIKFW